MSEFAYSEAKITCGDVLSNLNGGSWLNDLSWMNERYSAKRWLCNTSPLKKVPLPPKSEKKKRMTSAVSQRRLDFRQTVSLYHDHLQLQGGGRKCSILCFPFGNLSLCSIII